MTQSRRLIALMGKSKSGKNAIGDMCCELATGGAQLAFADKLKEVCMDLFDLTHDDVYTDAGKNKVLDFPCYKCPACGSIDAWLEAPNQVVCKKCTAIGEALGFKSNWTVRMLLQHVGTEGIRRVDDKVWVRHAIKRADALLTTKLFVVITDCRFKSEADAVWAAGGEVWRIRRPTTDNHSQGLAGHVSETEMDTIPDSMFQHVINNNGTLDNLRDKVDENLSAFIRGRT